MKLFKDKSECHRSVNVQFPPWNSIKLLGLAEKMEVEEIIDIVRCILDLVKNIEITSIVDSLIPKLTKLMIIDRLPIGLLIKLVAIAYSTSRVYIPIIFMSSLTQYSLKSDSEWCHYAKGSLYKIIRHTHHSIDNAFPQQTSLMSRIVSACLRFILERIKLYIVNI